MSESFEREAVQEAVQDLYRRLIDAWNARDAQAFAGLFAPAGSVVGFDGSQMNGRAEIASTLGAIFADHPTSSYVTIVREVRPVGADAALLRAVCGMTPPGGGPLIEAVNAIQSLVAARSEAGWGIELFQNTPAAFHGRPEVSAQLTEELRGALAEAGGAGAS